MNHHPPSHDVILQNTGQLQEQQLERFVADSGIDASLSFLAHRRIAFLRFASGEASAKFHDRFAGDGQLVVGGQPLRVDYCRDEALMDGWMCEVTLLTQALTVVRRKELYAAPGVL